MSVSQLFNKSPIFSMLHSRMYIEGCIAGVCASPEIPLPYEWISWTIKHHQQINDSQQADDMADYLLDVFKQRLSDMNREALYLPLEVTSLGDDQTGDARTEYFKGLLFAHCANEKVWNQAWELMLKKNENSVSKMHSDLKHCLLMFSTFAEPQKAIDNDLKLPEKERKGLAEKLPLIAKSLPSAFEKYLSLSNELAKHLPNQFETFSVST